MKMLKSILFFVFCMLLSTIQAQDTTPKAMLSTADIDLFIKTYKPIAAELESLGDQYNNIQDPTVANAFKTNEKVKSTFKKYGWTNDFFEKITAITLGYTFIKSEEEISKLPEDQRKMIAESMQSYQANIKSQINDADFQKVKLKMAELDVFFEAIEE